VDWMNLVAALLGGGAMGTLGKAAFDRWASRDRLDYDREMRLWQEIGALQNELKDLRHKLEAIENDRDALRVENTTLKIEVNDLLGDKGAPPKYPIAVVLTAKTP
jgi:septal ring factor EnvC (AmiA/AmiB activator)